MAELVPDALPAYRRIGQSHPSHMTVNHSKRQYARTDVHSGERVNVNTAESYHALLRRMVVGVHHWIGGKHLDRYAAQTAHAWNHRTRIVPHCPFHFMTRSLFTKARSPFSR